MGLALEARLRTREEIVPVRRVDGEGGDGADGDEAMRNLELSTAQANGCSLPGDGLRIKGSGPHRAARILESFGLVRVAESPGFKSRVHITQAGRRIREQIASDLLLMGTSDYRVTF